MDELPQPPRTPPALDYGRQASPSESLSHDGPLAAYASVILALLQVPWMCGPARTVLAFFNGSYNPADGASFIVGRAVLILPAVLALVFGRFALNRRWGGSHRGVAVCGLVFGVLGLLLVFFATRGGD